MPPSDAVRQRAMARSTFRWAQWIQRKLCLTKRSPGRERYRPPRGGAESFLLEPPGTFDALEAGDFQSIERIGDRAQMLGREMQVDEGVLQPGMSEWDLNGTQVGARFQKVGSTT